jgi:hypothetical protein
MQALSLAALSPVAAGLVPVAAFAVEVGTEDGLASAALALAAGGGSSANVALGAGTGAGTGGVTDALGAGALWSALEA